MEMEESQWVVMITSPNILVYLKYLFIHSVIHFFIWAFITGETVFYDDKKSFFYHLSFPHGIVE